MRQLEKKWKKLKKKRERTEFIAEDMLKNWPAVGRVENGYLAQQQGSGTTALFVQHNDGSQKVPFFPAAQHRRQRACVRACVSTFVRQTFQGDRADARRQIHIHNGGHISPAI